MKPKLNTRSDRNQYCKQDDCQTPAYALGPLRPYLDKNALIWEPAVGEGYLARGLAVTNVVVVSDIRLGQNFFDFQPPVWDILVTNPPYSVAVKYPWIVRCYELGKPFAILMALETLGAAKAQRYFDKYGLEIIFMDKRVDFKMPDKGWSGGGAQYPTAWFTWGLNIGHQMTFAHLEKPSRKEVLSWDPQA